MFKHGLHPPSLCHYLLEVTKADTDKKRLLYVKHHLFISRPLTPEQNFLQEGWVKYDIIPQGLVFRFILSLFYWNIIPTCKCSNQGWQISSLFKIHEIIEISRQNTHMCVRQLLPVCLLLPACLLKMQQTSRYMWQFTTVNHRHSPIFEKILSSYLWHLSYFQSIGPLGQCFL